MSNYTFTTSTSYALSTHQVSFNANTLTVKLSSTGQTVYSGNYSSGLAFMCDGDDFCIGSLNDNGVFTKVIDMAKRNAELKLVEQTGANTFIGTNDANDSNITNKYNLNQCPVRLVDGPGKQVDIECPCESSSGTCTHTCYTYG